MPLSRLSQQLLRSDSVALWLTGLAFTALHICHQLPIKGFTARRVAHLDQCAPSGLVLRSLRSHHCVAGASGTDANGKSICACPKMRKGA
jgi:hypothetical protein